MTYLLEGREAVRLARVHGAGAELLLDAQQLVVLGEALRAARRARLDLVRVRVRVRVRVGVSTARPS